MGSGASKQRAQPAAELREALECLPEEELRIMLRSRLPEKQEDDWEDENCDNPATTVVHRTAARGDVRALRACLAADASLAHVLDRDGCTPLHHAARNFQAAAVEALLAAGADAGARDRYGRSAAHDLAICAGSKLTVVQHMAADAVLRRLAAAGLDVLPAAEDEDGGAGDWTALHSAAELGNLMLLRLLVKRGGGWKRAAAAADRALLCELVTTAQRPALASEALRLLGLLLQHGAPADARSACGATALLHAARAAPKMEPKHVAPLLELLLNHGADPLAVDDRGRNVFHGLAGGLADCTPPSAGALEQALRVLLPVAGGPQALNAPDAQQRRPLGALLGLPVCDEAHAREVAACVHALLAAGADLHAPQGAGLDAGTLPEKVVQAAVSFPALRKRGMATLGVLRQAGWDINSTSQTGRTVLQSFLSFTASNGYHCMLHYDEEGQELAEPRPAYGANFWAVLGQLLEWGADPNQHQRDPSVYAEHVARAAGVYNWSAARSSKPAESPINIALDMPVEVLRRLVEAGADASQADETGEPHLLVLWTRFVDRATSHIEAIRTNMSSTRGRDLGEEAARYLRWYAQRVLLLRAAGAPPLSAAQRGQLGPGEVQRFFRFPDARFPEPWAGSGAQHNLELARQVLLGGPEWSRERHAEALAPFRAATRTLLLINRHRGFPLGPAAGGPVAAAAPSPKPSGRRVRQRRAVGAARGSVPGSSSGGSGSQEGSAAAAELAEQAQQRGPAAHQVRASLEPEILLSILRAAAADVGPWLALTQQARPWSQRERAGYWSDSDW